MIKPNTVARAKWLKTLTSRHPRCETCGHWAPLRNPHKGFALVGGYCTMVDSKWANDPTHYCAEHTNLADSAQRGENA